MSSLQLVGIVTIALLIIHKVFVKPLSSPFRDLPAPEQGPARKRLLVEPSSDQLAKWAQEIPRSDLMIFEIAGGLMNEYGRIVRISLTALGSVTNTFWTLRIP